MTSTPTAYAVSPDSGEHWSAPGAWRVADGIHRIPLPLPSDGLKAVNVYVIAGEQGLTLVDGGWAITEARETLAAGLAQLDAGFGDIRRFLVTHVHRDHYTLASVLGDEFGAETVLGAGEKPALDAIESASADRPILDALRSAGAHDIADRWAARTPETMSPQWWRTPDVWLSGDVDVAAGERTLAAIHTPGHTQGHYVYADQDAGLLFAGDHVLPTITPSIGFEAPPVVSPLGDFMASLTKVRASPDRMLLPAHGPVAPSAHQRIDELLDHHEHRLALCLAALTGGRLRTAAQVAGELPWTRHEYAYATLDSFNAGLAAMETKAHLELLVARGRATRRETEAGVVFAASR